MAIKTRCIRLRPLPYQGTKAVKLVDTADLRT